MSWIFFKNAVMKILFVINNLLTGGAERLVTETLLAIDHNLVSCDLVLLSQGSGFLKQDLFKLDKVNLIELKKNSPYHPDILFKLQKIIKKNDF